MSIESPDTLEQMANMTDEDFMSGDWSFEEDSVGDDTSVDTGSDEPVIDDEPTDEGYEQDGEEDEYIAVDESEDEDDGEDDEPLDEEEPSTDEPSEAEAELKKLIGTPIKAAGGEITLQNVDEAIRLVQMGMDYHKKTQEMAPHRKAIATLEKAQLLDADKLNMVIDVMSGKPEAIRKLMADKQISVDAIDTDEPNNYQPENHSVTDNEVELKDVLNALRSTPEGTKVLDIVSNQWDAQSRQAIVEQPSNLRHLEQQVKDGSYEKIMNEVSRRTLLGMLPANMSTLQAYAQVGKELLGGEAPQQSQPTRPQPTKETKPTNPEGRKRVPKARKTGTRPSAPSAEKMAEMSDEDFLKLFK